MAECKKNRELISCYADGELSGNEREELEKHLETCVSCRSLLALYRNITKAAAESLEEPPDTFTDSVMRKIKALPEEMKTEVSAANKPRKPIKPILISFVAAAACLALAIMASPGLFSLTGSRNATASIPMASAAPAPAAAYDAAAKADSAEFSALDTGKKAESGGGTDSGAADSESATQGAGTAAQAPLMMEATVIPSPAASAAPQLEGTWKNSVDELKKYYAIFIIEGQLPEGVDEKGKTDNNDGTFSVEISVETANKLIQEGFAAEMGAPESVVALVKYTP